MTVTYKFCQPSFWNRLRSRFVDWECLFFYFILMRFSFLFLSSNKKCMFLLEKPRTLVGPAWRLLHFLLFSFLCFPKLALASYHAKYEFFLKKGDVREILDFSDITRLRKLWPGVFNSLPARYSGSPVWVLPFCFSLLICIFLQYSRWYSTASSHNGRE